MSFNWKRNATECNSTEVCNQTREVNCTNEGYTTKNSTGGDSDVIFTDTKNKDDCLEKAFGYSEKTSSKIQGIRVKIHSDFNKLNMMESKHFGGGNRCSERNY